MINRPNAEFYRLEREVNGHHYIVRYTPGSENEALNALIEMAQDKNTNFNYFDAACMSLDLCKNIIKKSQRFLSGFQ